MADQRDKILGYYRAQYLIEHPESIRLSACLREACDKRKTVAERTIERSGGQFVRIAKETSNLKKGIFLHLTADTPGEAASVVPTVRPGTNELGVTTAHAPVGQEYMDGDAFLYIVGNDICLCTTTMRLAGVQTFLQEFLRLASTRKDADQFAAHRALDVDRIALIDRIGVKSIELKGNMYAESAEYHKRQKHVAGILGVVAKQIRALVSTEHDVGEDALKVTVVMQLDGRQRGQTIGYQRLKSLAKDVVKNQHSDDQYTIVLNNGEKIGPNDIHVRSFVKLDSVGKTVPRDQAWTALENYYNFLRSTGALEQ